MFFKGRKSTCQNQKTAKDVFPEETGDVDESGRREPISGLDSIGQGKASRSHKVSASTLVTKMMLGVNNDDDDNNPLLDD